MSKNEYVKFGHFKRLLTSDDYYVWNNFESKEQELSETESENLVFDLPNIVDSIETAPTLNQMQSKSYGFINKKFYDFIQPLGRVGIIPITMKVEDKIEETKKLLKNNSIDIIVDPVFEYKGSLASPSLYDKRDKKISNLKISTSTKRIDLLKPYWDYQIMTKNNILVESISYFVLDTKLYQPHDISFYETYKVNTTVAARSDKTAKEHNDFISMRRKKTGNGVNKKSIPDEKNTIFNIIALHAEFGSKSNPIQFNDFDYYNDLILNAKDAKNPNGLTLNDIGKGSKLGKNPYVEQIINKYHPEYVGFSRRLAKYTNIINGVTLKEEANSNILLDLVLNRPTQILDKTSAQEYVDKCESGRVIWYDFEGFALPYPTIDSYQPFQQVAFQVSVIETLNGKSTNTKDHIFDPKSYSYRDFPKMIDLVYSDGADYYVVYNQAYENTRLLEMVATLRDKNYPNWVDYQEKVFWILERTVDLMNLFRGNNIISIPDLKGKYSIKTIEKYVTKNDFNLETMITPYNTLEIQNGMMAMDEAIKRVLDITGDKQWEQIEENLIKYCHNDVKSMIMVKDLVKMLLKK